MQFSGTQTLIKAAVTTGMLVIFSLSLYRLCGHVCVVDGCTWILVSCLWYNKPCREISSAKKSKKHTRGQTLARARTRELAQ